MKVKLEMILNDNKLQEKIVNNCQPIIDEFTPKKFANRWDLAIKDNLLWNQS